MDAHGKRDAGRISNTGLICNNTTTSDAAVTNLWLNLYNGIERANMFLEQIDTAQKELKRLADETGMFGSITDEEIAANAGKTYQDVTALRDPLAGLGFGE